MKPGYLSEVFTSFQGEGAQVGYRHLFVRLAGCNLRCRYCDTPDSLERGSTYTVYGDQDAAILRPNPVSVEDASRLLTTLLAAQAPIDAIALTGGEPLLQSEFLAALLETGRFGVPVLLETSGVLPQRLRDVLSLVSIVSMDLKLPSNAGEGPFWDEHAEFLSLARAKALYVKILVDQATHDEDVGRAVSLLRPLHPSVPAFMQPIVDGSGRPMIDTERLTHLYLTARRNYDNIRVLPQTHKILGVR